MAESISALIPLQDHEGRQHDRTHMFVAATLYSGSNSCPVNIRNMSLSGALIEGAVLPARDASITLRRGSLQAAAKIVWAAGRKAGVAFCAAVQVGDWMSRTPPSHQARVDEILRGVREGASGPTAPADASPVAPIGTALEAELKALQEELTQLETGLTNDMDVVAKHPEIQLLDIALQRVGRLLAGASRF
jgi:hypothetical protein